MSSQPYQDEQKLREAYERLGNQKEVAEEFDCVESTICKWMKKLDIEAKIEKTRIKVECSNCGNTVEIKPYLEDKRNNHFCDYDCHAEWQSENKNGENNHNWKEPAEMECEWCENTFHFPAKYKKERRFCSLDCANEWKSEELGGGRYDSQLYYGGSWREVRKQVIKRDSVCRICGHDGSEDRHEIHHITPLAEFESPKEANKMENLILLCSVCHRDVEWGNQTVPEINNNE
jgi:5-methylcytosine-specific restriction endonuclease McrA